MNDLTYQVRIMTKASTVFSTGPLAVPISLYYSLLSPLHSLHHSNILYYLPYSVYITLLFSTGTMTVLYHFTILDCPFTVPTSLYVSQLPHNQSICHSTLFLWPTDSPYITSILYFPLTVPISLYYTLSAH